MGSMKDARRGLVVRHSLEIGVSVTCRPVKAYLRGEWAVFGKISTDRNDASS